jgi:choline dehydrogenase-like flavoprotein
MSQPTFDAIVVGSGITGGWAAKVLAESGLKVLMLERGRRIEHGRYYVGEHMPPWQVPFRGKPLRELYARDYAVQSRVYAFDETTRHFWMNDRENPYITDERRPFQWVRANVLGGRSLLWGRQVYRWSDLDFEANLRDGHGVDWPIRYRDLAPWYAEVERFIGVSGQREGLAQLPDGEFMPPMALNVVELEAKRRIEASFTGRRLTIGRVAVLTQPHDGRGACHYCGPCHRGCSVGAYFSSLSSTLPAALRTGNLEIVCDAVVEKVEYDAQTKRATVVRVVDTATKETRSYSARMIFMCASTVGTLQVLLNSRSEAFPAGLANRSGVLGRYLMDHTSDTSVYGVVRGFDDRYDAGARPNGIYVPRFRNLSGTDADADFLRGYGYQGGAYRMDWRVMALRTPGFGAGFKESLRRPGPWIFGLNAYGECLPYARNRIELDARKRDRYGIPLVKATFAFGANEERQRRDSIRQARAMLGALGVEPASQNVYDGEHRGGDAIHEMGGARMGHDPATSVLNAWNQAHDVANLFVTDGACMTSSSCVNPSMTYMAITARAASRAADLVRAGQL